MSRVDCWCALPCRGTRARRTSERLDDDDDDEVAARALLLSHHTAPSASIDSAQHGPGTTLDHHQHRPVRQLCVLVLLPLPPASRHAHSSRPPTHRRLLRCRGSQARPHCLPRAHAARSSRRGSRGPTRSCEWRCSLSSSLPHSLPLELLTRTPRSPPTGQARPRRAADKGAQRPETTRCAPPLALLLALSPTRAPALTSSSSRSPTDRRRRPDRLLRPRRRRLHL